MTPHPVRPGVQQHCSNIPLEEKRKRQDFLAWSQISLTEKLPFHQNALSLAANAAVWARPAPQEHLHPQCNQPPLLPQSRNALSCGALRNAATFRGGARPYSRHSAARDKTSFAAVVLAFLRRIAERRIYQGLSRPYSRHSAARDRAALGNCAIAIGRTWTPRRIVQGLSRPYSRHSAARDRMFFCQSSVPQEGSF